MIYSAEAKSVFLSLSSTHHPPTLTVSHFAYPGMTNVPFRLSGQHPYVGVSTTPDNLASETARGFGVADATHATGWNPASSAFHADDFQAYRWQDWLVFPHHTFVSFCLCFLF